MTNASTTMILDVGHFRDVSDRNVHLVRWCNDADNLEAVVHEAARSLDYHFAMLDGRSLRTQDDVLRTLDEAFHFPKWSRDPIVESWNGARDWLGDLSWLIASPSTRKGVVTLLRDPEPFMVANLLQCAVLIDALIMESQSVMRDRKRPVHVVVGPLPHDYWYECFLNLMSASKHFCEACQSVDCPCEECGKRP